MQELMTLLNRLYIGEKVYVGEHITMREKDCVISHIVHTGRSKNWLCTCKPDGYHAIGVLNKDRTELSEEDQRKVYDAIVKRYPHLFINHKSKQTTH